MLLPEAFADSFRPFTAAFSADFSAFAAFLAIFSRFSALFAVSRFSGFTPMFKCSNEPLEHVHPPPVVATELEDSARDGEDWVVVWLEADVPGRI